MHVCFTISSVSLIYLNVTILSEYLPHKWKYVIGWNLSVFPYKLLSLILKILTSLTTIACHQQQSAHHLHNSVSYSTFLLRARHASKKVTPYHISCAILRIQIFVATPRSRRLLMLNAHPKHHSLWYKVQNMNTLFSLVDAAHIDIYLPVISHHNTKLTTVYIKSHSASLEYIAYAHYFTDSMLMSHVDVVRV